MGFTPAYINQGHMQGWERLPAAAITPKVGMALVFSSGKLTTATGTTRPTHISMLESSTTVVADTKIPVIAVDDNALYDTTNADAFTNVKVGDLVSIAAGGLKVTPTASGSTGVAQVVYMEGTAVGSKITVRFPG